jgi:YrbI family 3-deoxy-D-manno-octulosonate 8-phosphate phosphatase
MGINRLFISKLAKIELLAFDFDGIFTDGFVYVDQNGKEMVRCSRRDSFGLDQLKDIGVYLAVISRESNPIVIKRWGKMGIECFINVADKIEIFKKLLKRKKIERGASAFMGDDISDLECLKYAGVAFTVRDAVASCKRVADYITIRKGGHHAVREICDLILKAKKKSI